MVTNPFEEIDESHSYVIAQFLREIDTFVYSLSSKMTDCMTIHDNLQLSIYKKLNSEEKSIDKF